MLLLLSTFSLAVSKVVEPVLERGDWGYRCDDPIDQAKFSEIQDDLTACGNYVTDMRGLHALGMFKACMSTKGYTSACTSCFGRFAFCSGLHCTYWCGHGGNGSFDRVKWFPPCQLCQLSCGKLLAECSGFGKLPQTMCHNNMKKNMWWLCDIVLNLLPNSNYIGPGGWPIAEAELGNSNMESMMNEFLSGIKKSYDDGNVDPRATLGFENIGKTLDFLSAMSGKDVQDVFDWAEELY